MSRFQTCANLLILLCLSLFTTLASAQKTPDAFTFLDVTDTHQTATGEIEPLKRLAKDALEMPMKPAFVIDTGDITEAGRPEEYARFKEGISDLLEAKIDFYPVPGNHDVRWSPDGKEGFTKAFGKLYRSFDYGGAHFVLLDSTVALEHWGHFDKAELDWLDKDLKRLRPETPIFLFMHHSVGRDTPETRFIDNEYDLLKKLKDRNVVAMFTGHGHSDLEWKTNGIQTYMARGLYQGSYYRVAVTPLIVTVDRVYTKDPGPVFHQSIPITRRAKGSILRAGWDDPDNPFLERKRPAVTLEPRAVADNPDSEKSEYRVDESAWKAMKKDARDIWRDTFATKGLAIGNHTTTVRLTTSSGVAISDELNFEVERESSEATRRWALNLEGPIQSDPIVVGDTLFTSCLDGKVYALSTDKGKKRWFFASKAPIYGTPLIDEGVLYVASSDHFLYAIQASNGRLKWKFDTGGVLFATPAVAKGVVCIGGNGKIFGVDLKTGLEKWEQPAGAFFQSKAATDGEAFYLGGWDNKLTSLDALTGEVRWRKPLGKNFYVSPAISSPCLSEGRVFICSNDNTLYSLDSASGETIWTAKAPKSGDVFGYSSPAVSGGKLFLAGLGTNGDVYAFDSKSGKPLWQSATGQQFYDSSVKVAPNGASLAIMGLRGKCSILDTANGKKLWGYELGPGNIFSTPSYDGKTLYTVTMANDVQAINAPLGRSGEER